MDPGEDELTVVDVLEDVVDVVESETKGAIERLRADVPIPNVILRPISSQTIFARRARGHLSDLSSLPRGSRSGLWFVLEADLPTGTCTPVCTSRLSFLGIYVRLM